MGFVTEITDSIVASI